MRVRGPDAESAGRLLPHDGAGRHALVRLRADDGDAKAAGAQRFGGALAVGADQIRHHVGRGLFAAVEQHRHAWRAGTRRRVLRDDGVGRVVGRAELRDGRDFEPFFVHAHPGRAFVLPDQAWHGRRCAARS